jgi:hypothetical protein
MNIKAQAFSKELTAIAMAKNMDMFTKLTDSK